MSVDDFVDYYLCVRVTIVLLCVSLITANYPRSWCLCEKKGERAAIRASPLEVGIIQPSFAPSDRLLLLPW